MTMRSTPTPSSISRSRMRSWVIGRCVTTPWRAKAMAVASTAPMKIGRTRCSPSASRRRTIGLLVGSSTRTPTRCISTTASTLPRVEGLDVGARVFPEGAQVCGDDPVEIAVTLGKIEAVAEHEVVLDLEAHEADGGGDDAPGRAVEQRASGDGAGLTPGQLVEQIGQGQARVDDVLDQDH